MHLSLIFTHIIVLLLITASSSFFAVSSSTFNCLTNANTSLTYNGTNTKIHPGFFSPHFDPANSSTYPVACVPTPACAALRALGRRCTEQQSSFEPNVIPSGYYSNDSINLIPCPEGFFCMLGSTTFTKCSSLASCPVNSERPQYFGSILFMCILLLLVIIAASYYNLRSLPPARSMIELRMHEREKQQKQQQQEEMKQQQKQKQEQVSAFNLQEEEEKREIIAVENILPTSKEKKEEENEEEMSIVFETLDGTDENENHFSFKNEDSLNKNSNNIANAPDNNTENLSASSFIEEKDNNQQHQHLASVDLAAASSPSLGSMSLGSSPARRAHKRLVAECKEVLGRGINRARLETGVSDAVRIDFSNVCVSVAVPEHETIDDEGETKLVKSKFLVKGACGVFEPCRINSLFGSAGCGKSILLNAILGKLDPEMFTVTGDIRFNGKSTLDDSIRSSVQYVPQFDVLIEELTVYDNLYYASELRLPVNWTAEEKEEFRDAILVLFGLSKHRWTKVSKISGGQSKRLAAAVAIAAAPSMCVLDEPTTGLSSGDAMSIIKTLAELAVVAKINIVLVIHQPRKEVFLLLDHMLCLATGGKVVYEGEIANIMDDLSDFCRVRQQDNPADVLIDTISRRGVDMASAWQRKKEKNVSSFAISASSPQRQLFHISNDKSEKSEKETTTTTTTTAVVVLTHRHASFGKQFLLFHERILQKILATYPFLLLEFGILILLGLILGEAAAIFEPNAVYRGDYARIAPQYTSTFLPQLLMFLLMSLGLAGSVAGVRTFGTERVFMERDADSGLSMTAFFFAATLASIYRMIVAISIFSGIIHNMGYYPTEYWSTFFGNFFLVYCCLNFIGEITSLLVDPQIASTNAATIALAFSILSGFISFPAGLKYLSFAFWSGEIVYTEYFSFVSTFSSAPYQDWSYDVERSDTAANYGILLAMALIYKFFVWLVLMLLVKKK